LKAAYRLIDRAAARPDDLQAVHRRNTRARAVACPNPVLFVHDGTQLDFSTHSAVADQLGPIGTGVDSARGFLQHNSWAVDPRAGAMLGLIHQQTFLRQPTPAGETRARRYQRRERESVVWERGSRPSGVRRRGRAGCTWGIAGRTPSG
jgi:predicted amidohydrolase